MRPKEAITGGEIEILLLLACKRDQTIRMIQKRLKADRTVIWKRLESLAKKKLVGCDNLLLTGETNPRGGRSAKRYFILDDKYDEIYQELKKRGYRLIQVVEAKFVVSHPFPPDAGKRYPGENIADYQIRTGFLSPMEALAFRDYYTNVRLATDEEIALYNILRNCSDYIQEAEKAERVREEYFDGFAYGPFHTERE